MQKRVLERSGSGNEKFEIIGDFRNRDILSANQFNRENLGVLFEKADEMKKVVEKERGNDSLKGNVLATLFYEPSTRTRLSFEAAMLRLGGQVISESNVQFSSAIKGERLEDTIRVVATYADIIALRHSKVGAAKIAAGFAPKPIINAGDGEGEHPTQALLDLYTIQRECGQIDGLTVTMLGDLKFGRTVHSLTRLLSLFRVRINFVSPEFLKIPPGQIAELREKDIEVTEANELSELKEDYDVLYVTRVQKERISQQESPAVAAHLQNFDKLYALSPEFPEQGRAVIMHPLPRVAEIPLEIDRFPKAAYFRQVENGLYIRMALLSLVLKGN